MIQKVFSLEKVIELDKRGIKPLYNEQNKKFPKLKVFCFVNDENFKKNWNEIISNK